MTITRIWQSGAEWANPVMEMTSAFDANFTVSAAEKKTGSYAFRTEGRSYGTVNLLTQYNLDLTVPASFTQLRMGMWVKHASATGGTSPRLLSFTDNDALQDFIIRLDVDTGAIQVYDGQGGTLLDSAVNATFAGPGWFHLGIDLNISATGWCYIYINGTEVISFDGDTANVITVIHSVSFGGVQATGNDWAQYLYFDDIYIDSTTSEVIPTIVPNYRFLLASADEDGITTDWVGSDGNSTDNFEMVDDIPSDGGTTYITTSTGATLNAVTVDNESIAGFDVVAVYPHAIVKAGADTVQELQIYVRDTITGNFGRSLNKPVGTSYHPIFDERTVSINTFAWSQTEIDNMQVGIETA